MTPLYRVHAGEEPLRQPRHDVGGSPEICARPRRAGEVATFRLGHYEWVVCGRAAEEASLRERRASPDAAAAPFCAYAPRLATSAAPGPRDHDEACPRCRAHLSAVEEREGATLRQRRASQDAAAAPFYRGGTPRQRRAAAPSRPTTPGSPRRPRRRHGTTARRGCGAARTSTPMRSSSLDEPEADAPSSSPLPGDGRSPGMRRGEDDMRDNCCVRRRLYGDSSRRCVRAAAAGCVGSGVKDLAGAPLQRAGDVRRSLSAEPDTSTSNGEEIPRGNDSEDRADRRLSLVDNSVAVLIGTPAEVGNVVPGCAKDLAGSPLQRTGEASSSRGLDSSVIVLIGKPADGGTVVKAAADVFLGVADREGWIGRLELAVGLGPMYWVEELIDWWYIMKGSPRDRERDTWSWHGVVGYPIEQHDGTCAICSTLVCLEARHRLDFERRHGYNTFPYRILAQTVEDLKNLCIERDVWTVKHGADGKKVLKLIQEVGGVAVAGVPGWNPSRFQVKTWKYHQNSVGRPMSQSTLARLIHMEGPILGALTVDKVYNAPGMEDYVYPGVPKGYKGTTNHLVVCTAYCLHPSPQRHWPDKTALAIQVVDNQEKDGPVRWIWASAFFEFIVVHVEPLDATELRVKKPSLWRRILNTVSLRHHL